MEPRNDAHFAMLITEEGRAGELGEEWLKGTGLMGRGAKGRGASTGDRDEDGGTAGAV